MLYKLYRYLLLGIVLSNLVLCSSSKNNDNISLFPLKNYSQDLNFYFSKDDPDFNTPLLEKTEQEKYFLALKNRTFGVDKNATSPWSKTYIEYLLSPEPETNKTIFFGETLIIDTYIRDIQSNVGINFRNYSLEYLINIQHNMNIEKLENLTYTPNNRAIFVDNALIKEIPTNDPFYKSRKIAGQGYPFDNHQLSSIYVGNPAYILSESKDKAWSLVVTNVCIGWVPSTSVKRVKPDFIKTWATAANKNLGSIIKPTAILDNENFRYKTYIGTLFPIVSSVKEKLQIMIPLATDKQYARIQYTYVDKDDMAELPLPLTRANFKRLITHSIGKPYGWGNLDYYNDCSAEIRSLYIGFGIDMPRNSVAQSLFLGKAVDLSTLTPEDRYFALENKGIPLLSMIYINGHIMLYLGKYQLNGKTKLMTYQDIWGLRPQDNSRRAVIGQSLIFPLQLEYEEDKTLISLLHRPLFKLILLDQFNNSKAKLGLSNLLY